MTSRSELAVYERRFRRSGLPLFIEDYSATHDVFTRAAPLFVLVFLLEMLGATSLDWSWWQNVVFTGGLFAVLGLAFLVLRLPAEVRRIERDAGADGPPT
jgi:hypothetical protein